MLRTVFSVLIKSTRLMFTMEKKYRYLFTLCIIFGFQIHAPVTMLPASWDQGSSFGSIEHALFDNGKRKRDEESQVRLINEPLIDARPSSREYKSTNNHISREIGYKAARVVEYVMPRHRQGEQAKYSAVLGSSQGEHYHLNRDVNQAGPADHRSFNTAEDLTGLERSLDLKHAKSPQSDFNRLSSDLVGVKVKQIEARLSNLSDELSARRNMLSQENRETNTQNKTKEIMIDTKVDNNKNRLLDNVTLNIQSNSPNRKLDVFDGILWSRDSEDKCPVMFSENDYSDWKRKVETHAVIKIEDGCGSMQNRLVTFNDSSKVCVRYRMNTELMQGEIYSFYLGKLLNMSYNPPTAMVVPLNSNQWRQVRKEAESAGWTEHKPAILTQWWPHLDHVYMPRDLRDPKSRLRPENYWLEHRPRDELCDIMQWTDLMVFDYISGNLDRVVNNLYNLKWNSKMLEKPIHNLMKIKTSGLFLFLDNESGLFHGYRLLDSYSGYHQKLLESVCVFRKSTVDAIEQLHKGGNTGDELQNLYQLSEPNHGSLPRMSVKNMKTLQERVTSVYKHIQLCSHMESLLEACAKRGNSAEVKTRRADTCRMSYLSDYDIT